MARTHERSRSLLRDQRGHAMAESVIMIPFFIIVWGSIIYVAQGFESTVDTYALTRGHAWAHVMDNCRCDPTRRVCRGQDRDTQILDATEPVFGPVGDLFALIDEVLSLIPFFSDYWPGWITEEREFRRSASVDKPSVLGGGALSVGSTIILMCNEQPQDVDLDELSLRAWNFLGI